MSVLSNEEIKDHLKVGEIVIDGFEKACMRPSSYLLRISPDLLFRSGEPALIDTRVTDTRSLFTATTIPEDGYCLEPGVLHLARSVERISLTSSICGELGLLSCYARVGVSLNLGSNQVAATFGANRPSSIVFEIVNSSQDTLIIYPGVKFCHLRFARHLVPASVTYPGIYASGDSILPADFSRKPAL